MRKLQLGFDFESNRSCNHRISACYTLCIVYRYLPQWGRSVVIYGGGGQGRSGQAIKLFQITST